jgi:hypothetical protein
MSNLGRNTLRCRITIMGVPRTPMSCPFERLVTFFIESRKFFSRVDRSHRGNVLVRESNCVSSFHEQDAHLVQIWVPEGMILWLGLSIMFTNVNGVFTKEHVNRDSRIS